MRLRTPLTQLAGFSLACGFSCSIWTPTAPSEGLTVSAAATAGPALGPGAVEWVQARFLRYQSRLAPFEVREVAKTIVAEAERLGLERSPVGALGLMQIMPETGEMLAQELNVDWQGPDTLFDPVVNVRLGTHYLAYLHKKYGSWDRALAAYNWGPQRIDRRLRAGAPLPARYVTQVTAHLQSPRLH
jgi:soluble lytic murein transglycosylase-like protein